MLTTTVSLHIPYSNQWKHCYWTQACDEMARQT